MSFEYVVNFMQKMRKDENYEEKSIMYGISSDYAANNNGIGNCKTLVAQ